MPVDTSMYQNLPPPPNFLKMGSDAIGLGNASLNNQLLQGQVQGRQAYGNALAAATNADGTLDANKLNKSIAEGAANGGPMSLYAPETAPLVGQVTSNRGAMLDQSNSIFKNGMGYLAPLVASGQPITRKQAMGQLSLGVATGAIPMQSLPTLSHAMPLDDKGTDAWVRQNVQAATSDITKVEDAGLGPDNRPIRQTKGQILTRATSPGGMVTGPRPGLVEAANVVGAESGKQLAGDLAESRNYPSRVYPLQQAIPLLEKLGPGYQGMVGQAKADFSNFHHSLTGSAPSNDPATAYGELKKYLTQEALRNGDSGTNDKLAATFAGNPSTDMNNAAATDVVKSTLPATLGILSTTGGTVGSSAMMAFLGYGKLIKNAGFQ
jgi:hypothetical protein